MTLLEAIITGASPKQRRYPITKGSHGTTIYGPWRIHYDPPPIPTRVCDWHWMHDDFDGADDACDGRAGSCASFSDALNECDEWEDENLPAPHHLVKEYRMSDEPEKPALNALWQKLSKTDPTQTKGFKRAGGFSGTAIKPMWVWQRLTEEFGPFGSGWGCDEPQFQVVPTATEVLVYCTVRAWHGNRDNALWGVGGDKVVAVYSSGPKADDEAFKKAYTDALMNAFKFIGVGADVHMGRFDDNKYVQEVAKEFAPPPEPPQNQRQAPPPLKGPIKTRKELRVACSDFVNELHACADDGMLGELLKVSKPLIDQVRDEHELFWLGDGADFNGMKREIELAELRVNEPIHDNGGSAAEPHVWSGG